MPSRCFVALPLPAPVRGRLAKAWDDLVALDPVWAGARAVRPELYHVTLAFLGAVRDEELPLLARDLSAAFAPLPPVRLRIGRLRALPRSSAATMLWADVDDPDGTAASARARCVMPLAARGFVPDPRPFHPHVTLARNRRPLTGDPAALHAASGRSGAGREGDGFVSVPHATLVASTEGPDGPEYETLSRFPFASPGGR